MLYKKDFKHQYWILYPVAPVPMTRTDIDRFLKNKKLLDCTSMDSYGWNVPIYRVSATTGASFMLEWYGYWPNHPILMVSETMFTTLLKANLHTIETQKYWCMIMTSTAEHEETQTKENNSYRNAYKSFSIFGPRMRCLPRMDYSNNF